MIVTPDMFRGRLKQSLLHCHARLRERASLIYMRLKNYTIWYNAKWYKIFFYK